MIEVLAVINLIVYISALGAAVYHTWRNDYTKATFFAVIVLMVQHGFSNG